jgi:hypothetical protein
LGHLIVAATIAKGGVNPIPILLFGWLYCTIRALRPTTIANNATIFDCVGHESRKTTILPNSMKEVYKCHHFKTQENIFSSISKGVYT